MIIDDPLLSAEVVRRAAHDGEGRANSHPPILRVCYAALSVCLLFSVMCLLERPAHAYVDPGSGLLAYQALTTLVAGTIFYFRQKLRNLFRNPRTDGEAPGPDATHPD